MPIRIGTRGSALAMWQAEFVADRLGRENVEIIVIKTQGDRILNVSFDKMEGKGFFTKEIEEALLSEKIDLAVHSLKDLPTEDVPGLELAAITEREDPSDSLIISPEHVDEGMPLHLKSHSTVGTSSLRRMAQLKTIDSTLTVNPLRGNVQTRLRKLREGQYDAIVLATAGIKRVELDIEGMVRFIPSFEKFLPAPAQGALGLQIRSNDAVTREAVVTLHDENTARLVGAERFFLKHFGGGCHIPLGAYAIEADGVIRLEGLVAATDGSKHVRDVVEGDDPDELGARLASLLKEKGADSLI